MHGTMILVGVDFSATSALAVEWARDLAGWGGGRVVAVHVAEGEAAVQPVEWREWLAGVGLGADDLVVRTGTPWLQLARYVDEVRPTLLVVGSHGRGGCHPVAPGSTATMLLTRVRVPVVVVPPHPAPPRAEGRKTSDDSNSGAAGAFTAR